MEFEYDQFGDPGAPPLLLVMGLGAQMTTWDEEFCEILAAKGFHVTRYDNRDIGLSTKLDQVPVPDIMQVVQGQAPPAYAIEDLADDAAAVIDALGIAPAHVVGASMGGFIVQTLAIKYPHKVRSLTSIMSGPGGRDATPAEPQAIALLLTPAPRDRDGLIEYGVNISRVIHGEFFDEPRARAKRTAAVDRSISIDGTARQLSACLAQPSRVETLHKLKVPTLVIHGDADPLVPYAEGVRTAEAVPGARLLTLERVGHDLPPHTWEEVATAIAEVAKAAQAPVAADR
jgi:pimeloyl-ACP methyl ester carboxylesterase